MDRINLLRCSALIAAMAVAAVQAADQTWSGGTTGTWDQATTANWDGGSVWANGNNALFVDSGENYVIELDAGVTVGDLTYQGTDTLQLKALVDNTALTLAGNATWNTGGGMIEFVNNQANDTGLDLAGYTLTVGGGGTFDTGEKANGSDWGAGDLVFTDATILRGAIFSVGQLNSVTLPGGSTFIQERNSNQTLPNAWELGSGDVTFKTRYARQTVLSGVIDGDGTLAVQFGQFTESAQDYSVALNASNTFTGGVVVDGTTATTILNINAENRLGATPVSFDADNITLRNGGYLRINGAAMSFDANRGITLDGGGSLIAGSNAHTINGAITGTGPLNVGREGDNLGNAIILTSTANDYTGQSQVSYGTLELGVDNALPATSVLNIGGSGGGTSRFEMNGFNATIGGLTSSGTNSKQVENGSTTLSTLTIDVAAGENYVYASNFADVGDIALVKEGEGTQRLVRSSLFSKSPVSLVVNEGTFVMSAELFDGSVTVNGGTLQGIGTFGGNATFNAGATISPGNDGGWNSLKFLGNLDMSPMIDDNAGGLVIGYGAAQDQIIVTNSAGTGTLDMDGVTDGDLGFSDFTFSDSNGLPSGTYAVLMADVLIGTLDQNDLSGPVGDLGATGTLSISDNTVYLTVIGSDVSVYGEWAEEFGLAKYTEAADVDGDGYSNFQEFAFGGNPTNSAMTGMVPAAGTLDDGDTYWFTMVYGMRTNDNPGVTYDVQTVNNLVIGTWTTDGISNLGYGVTVDGITPVTNAIPLDSSMDFLGVFLEKQE
ncbi:beta strand repeat-containing protein [Pontiella sp.]|uniref:beta strand repeat-containing protein n=1 Tax=Pontiella sp. TaxID=2837462 RepID=UPI0035680389